MPNPAACGSAATFFDHRYAFLRNDEQCFPKRIDEGILSSDIVMQLPDWSIVLEIGAGRHSKTAKQGRPSCFSGYAFLSRT